MASTFLDLLHHPGPWYHQTSRKLKSLRSIKRPMISQLQYPTPSTLARSSYCWMRIDHCVWWGSGSTILPVPIHHCTFSLKHLTTRTERLKKSNHLDLTCLQMFTRNCWRTWKNPNCSTSSFFLKHLESYLPDS